MKRISIFLLVTLALLAVACDSAETSKPTPTTGASSGPAPVATRAYANEPTDALASVLPATTESFHTLSGAAWRLLDLGPERVLPQVLKDGAAELSDEELIAVWDDYLSGTRMSIQGGRQEEWFFCENHTALLDAPIVNLRTVDWEIIPDPGGSRGAVKMVWTNERYLGEGDKENIAQTRAVEVRDGEARITPLGHGTTGRIDDPQVVTELTGDCPVPE